MSLIIAQEEKDDFGHWLSGFVDGEGCFTLSIATVLRNKRTYPKVIVGFVINLRKDDAEILNEISDYFGCGILRFSTNGEGNPKCTYYINGIENCFKIVVPHFERYPLRAKKKKDFEIWADAVRYAYNIHNQPRTSSGELGGYSRWKPEHLLAMQRFAQELRMNRVYREIHSVKETPFTRK